MEEKGDLSQRILAAARPLFFSGGFANTQLRSIANEAGTSESGILRVFESKGSLLLAVFVSCWVEINASLSQSVKEAAEANREPGEVLVDFVRAALDFYPENRSMMAFLLSHFGSPETFAVRPKGTISARIVKNLRAEWQEYHDRILLLCERVIRERPQFTTAGVTSVGLMHLVQSIVFGIQTSWFMEDEQGVYTSSEIDTEQALAVLRLALFSDRWISTDGCTPIAPGVKSHRPCCTLAPVG
jgi:AcrR family transcriptional regulator